MKLLATNPERFITATLGGSAGARGTPAAQTVKFFESVAAEFATDVPFRSLIPTIAPSDEPAPTEEMIRKRSQEMVGSNDTAAMAAAWLGIQDLYVTNEEIAAVRTPTQAVAGSADLVAPSVNALKRVWPGLKVVIVDGATHTNNSGRGAIARPEFLGAIREFVAAHRR